MSEAITLKKGHPLDKPIKFEGLVDNGKVKVKCSACNKELAYIWKTRPDEDYDTTFARIKCPYCQDHSFEVTVRGGYHLGHSLHCDISTIDVDDSGKTIIEVIKGGVKQDE